MTYQVLYNLLVSPSHYQAPLCSSLTTMISCSSNTTISFLPHGLHYLLFLVSRTTLPRLPQACSFRSVCSLGSCHIRSSSLTTLLKWRSPAFSNPQILFIFIAYHYLRGLVFLFPASSIECKFHEGFLYSLFLPSISQVVLGT